MAARVPPDFTVSVEGAFREDGVWLIDAQLRLRDGFGGEARREAIGKGRLALLQGIVREGLRGRTLGADRARVRLDTGDRVMELNPEEPIPDDVF